MSSGLAGETNSLDLQHLKGVREMLEVVLDVEGVTDARGEWKVRGFHGDYEITARLAQRKATVKATLPKNGAATTISLP